MTWNTGNNEPVRRGVLREALAWLEKRELADYVGPIGDVGGTYAYKIRIQGQVLYLVARASPPYLVDRVGYVSTQKALVNIAAQEKRQILLALWVYSDQDPVWSCFSAEELKTRYAKNLQETARDNQRKGSRMLNYEYDHGLTLRDPSKIWEKLDKVQVQQLQRKKYQEVNVITEAFGTEPTELQDGDLVTCGTCEAQYYRELPICPGCKAPNHLKESSAEDRSV